MSQVRAKREAYLASHDVSDRVAECMRKGSFIPGMTLEEVRLTLLDWDWGGGDLIKKAAWADGTELYGTVGATFRYGR